MVITSTCSQVQLVHINGYYMYLRSEDTLEVLPVIMDLLPDGQQQGIDLCVVGWGSVQHRYNIEIHVHVSCKCKSR